jgi:branched-chain amino acid transport system permease protein
MLSLSNAASMAVGAYTSAVLTTGAGWPLWPAVGLGAGAAGFVALLLGLPILRLRGVFLAIATIGFGEVVRIVVVNTEALGGPQGFRVNAGAFSVTASTLEIFAALAVVAYFFARLKGSRMGLALEAIREDESAARTTGINVNFYKVAAYVTGATLAGLAGGLYAHSHPFIQPGNFGFQQAVDILVFAVVGGTLGWRGPVVGALLMTILVEVLRALPRIGGVRVADYPEIFTGLVLLAVILFLPNGLLSAALGIRPRRPLRPLPEQASLDPVPSELGNLSKSSIAGKEDEPAHTGAGPQESAP